MPVPISPETLARIDREMDDELLEDLTPEIDDLLARHLSHAQEWFPHEMVPYGDARDYSPDELWTPDDSPISEGVSQALFVNLWTEDNLPHYHNLITGQGTPLEPWTNQWTAEEGRHAIVMREYILARRLLDPRELERGRMHQVVVGEIPRPKSLAETLGYTSFQELATKVAHDNTGHLLRDELSDEVGSAIMERVGKDEGLHFSFYSALLKALGERDPDRMMVGLSLNIPFAMPGTGIEGYVERSKKIAKAGIFGFSEVHQVADRTIKAFKIDSVEGLSAEGEAARDLIHKNLSRLGTAAKREKARRARAAESELVSA